MPEVKEVAGQLLDRKQMAGFLGVSVATVIRLQEAGELPPAIRIGKCWRWRPETVFNWIEEQSKNV